MSLPFSKLFLFSPPETSIGGTMSPEMGKEDIIDFLNKDDEEVIPLESEKKDDKGGKKTEETKKETKTPDEEDKGETEETGEDDELKDIEDELEGPSDEQLELVTPVRRKEILAKYPTLFKDFPYLEKAYYREQQFTEVYPTIDDAKEAYDKARTLDNFDADLKEGNTEKMLLAAKSAGPKTFNKLVDNYLSTLAEVDDKAHNHVVGNIIKHTIIAMVNEGRTSNNEVLTNAAVILNQFIFGKSNFEQPKQLSSEVKDDERETKLNQEKKEFTKQRLDVAVNDINGRVNNAYKSTIDANIDPKQSMSDYVRKTASREALENLENLISKDTRFKMLVDKLWEKAIKENFAKSAVDKVRAAYVSKARTLLPSVIKKARNDALKGMGKRVVEDKDIKEDTTTTRTRKSSEREEQSPSHKSDRGKKIPEGMTSLEFLMQED